jgi:quercetin dioxygenase-like cupin family protein
MPSPDVSSLVRIGALELRFLLDETQGSGDLIVFEFLVPPGARVPEPHYHLGVDEFLYGLEGVVTSRVNDTTHELRAGETLFIPRGAMHHHSNQSDKPAKALVTLNPGTINKRYFQEIGAAVGGPGKPDPAVIADIMARYDLIVE